MLGFRKCSFASESPCKGGGGRVGPRVGYFTEAKKKIVSFKRFLCAKGLSMLMV